MLKVNRHNEIARVLAERKFVSVEELARQFDVSGETIRRDFRELEADGLLKRAHGGAYIEKNTNFDISVAFRQTKLVENKAAIAQLCQKLVNQDDTVFLDASTTALEVAKALAQMRLTIITYSLLVANYLAQYPNIRLIMLGGIYNDMHRCFLGIQTEAALEKCFARKAFISCRSMSMNQGPMDSNEQMTRLRQLMLGQSDQCYLLGDYTKLDRTSLYQIGEYGDFAGVVLDYRPNRLFRKMLDDLGVGLFSAIDKDAPPYTDIVD